jgi:Flp pilus assembly protein TadB
MNDINPNHAYAVTAGATAVSWSITNVHITLHILASVVVIVSGLLAIVTYLRTKQTNSNKNRN